MAENQTEIKTVALEELNIKQRLGEADISQLKSCIEASKTSRQGAVYKSYEAESLNDEQVNDLHKVASRLSHYVKKNGLKAVRVVEAISAGAVVVVYLGGV